ncbi:glycosyltransferase family 2 protein [Methylobacter sp.]|uniref:glycosyltransferase family 2 protein n=1 Tax=Methylobacter sp. TaxID=2051955 RepID=UPI003DA3F4DA
MSLVSILIPAYNAERWIAETINSALNQTWNEKEIIIVDDGSKDATLQVAKRFESGLVKVIAQENSGASAARNKALEFAQGDYIQWLDADDLLAPEKIRLQMAQREAESSERVLYSSAWAPFYIRPEWAKFYPNSLWSDLQPVDWLVKKFDQGVWMNTASWLVSRRLTELAGPWDERLSLDDDGEYFSRVVAASDHVKFTENSVVYYRQSNIGSLSRSVSEKACNSMYLSLCLCIGYLRRLEDSDRTKAACVSFLQGRLNYFYPEREDLLRQIYALARDLGGDLEPSRLNWKYLPIKALFGWKAAKQMSVIESNMKIRAHVQYEKLLMASSGK